MDDLDIVTRGPNIVISAFTCAGPPDDVTHNDNFATVLESHVHVSSMQDESSLTTGTGAFLEASMLTSAHLTLAKHCSITPKRVKKYIRKTSQRGVRTCLRPSVACWFPTNNSTLCYNHLPHTLFIDAVLAGTPSTRNNKYRQVFASSYGWSCFCPMKKKHETHEALLGPIKEVDYLLKQIKPHLPWINTTEPGIRKLKRGSSRKMIKSQSPKKLWDYCLQLEARIHSCTVNDIYLCDNECPEIIMNESHAGISDIYDFSWCGSCSMTRLPCSKC